MEELVVDNAPESSKGIIGLCSDASTGVFYAFDDNSIFQVRILILAFESCYNASRIVLLIMFVI